MQSKTRQKNPKQQQQLQIFTPENLNLTDEQRASSGQNPHSKTVLLSGCDLSPGWGLAVHIYVL